MLITLTLLAFVVILLVGLSAYTRIETAVAGNTQRQAQARQNALLALNAAVAHLQRYAGPDQRVTATAEAFPNTSGTRYYTAVWDATGTGPTPMTWLVSGNEVLKPDGTGDPLAVTPAAVPASTVELVGKNTSGVAGDVVAPLVAIKSYGVPGQFANDNATTGGTTIGRYAWWVGDQGVKAPVALADRTAAVNYAPWNSAELNSRIRQQIGLGAGPADAAGNAVFEPRDAANAALTANTSDFGQLAFFNKPSGGPVGLAALQQNYHAWSPNNFAVLANTKLGGLRQDLSLKPDLLGSAFAAWADYKSYMEDPTSSAGSSFPPLPAFSSDPIRRRYIMQPASSNYPIAPVLSFFGLSFSLHNDTTQNSTTTKLIASIRCVVELWNPYSSALVPENLELVVQGLPTVSVASPNAPSRLVDLQTIFRTSSGTVKFALPFTSDGQTPDSSSWLPGRVYCWSALSQSGDPGSSGYSTQYNLRNAATASIGSISGVERDAGAPIGPETISSVTQRRHCAVGVQQTLTIELRRASTSEVLARFTSPTFDQFDTFNGLSSSNNPSPGGKSSDFAYVFRLPDTNEIPSGETERWLESAGRDIRESPFPVAGHNGFIVTGGHDLNPGNAVTSGQSGFPATYPDLLLDRYTNAYAKNYNEDVPILELPRSPLLSLGELQHFFVSGARPFSVGNSWGVTAQINGVRSNEIFDRFFVSGLAGASDPDIAAGRPLPDSLLKVLPHKTNGSSITAADLRAAPDARSSKHVLQSASFNFNSASANAWVAVLRALRFSPTNSFAYLDADAVTGTAEDGTLASLQNSDAQFFRFSQSAQEVFKADDDYTQSITSPTGSGPVINTPLFRRGRRTLDPTQLSGVANAAVTALKEKLVDSGPYRTTEEFLSPSPLFLDANGQQVSLLEKAIADAGLNANVAEYSSQFLTQADIMTALAPVLFPRSDTFVIRAYGEAVNPATGATEGRAWCEATLQRVPAYFDPSDPEETALASLNSTNQAFGRRFKIVSFRWLTHSDI